MSCPSTSPSSSLLRISTCSTCNYHLLPSEWLPYGLRPSICPFWTSHPDTSYTDRSFILKITCWCCGHDQVKQVRFPRLIDNEWVVDRQRCEKCKYEMTGEGVMRWVYNSAVSLPVMWGGGVGKGMGDEIELAEVRGAVEGENKKVEEEREMRERSEVKGFVEVDNEGWKKLGFF